MQFTNGFLLHKRTECLKLHSVIRLYGPYNSYCNCSEGRRLRLYELRCSNCSTCCPLQVKHCITWTTLPSASSVASPGNCSHSPQAERGEGTGRICAFKCKFRINTIVNFKILYPQRLSKCGLSISIGLISPSSKACPTLFKFGYGYVSCIDIFQ